MKSLQATNQPFRRRSSNPDRKPIMRVVPTTTAHETVKTESCCSVPGQAEMRMDGLGRTNAAEYGKPASHRVLK